MRKRGIRSGSRSITRWIMIDLDTEDEVKVSIEYDYEPEEPMVRYYSDGSGYPGSPAMIEVTRVVLDSGRELEWGSIPKPTCDTIEEMCWEDVEDQYERANDPE